MQNYPTYQQAPAPKQNFWQRKSKKVKFGIVGICLLIPLSLCICVSAMNASSGNKNVASSTTTNLNTSQQANTEPTNAPTAIPPTAKPTSAPTWKTIQSFSGDGTQKTAIFTVPDDWKINYTCSADDGMGIGGYLGISVYGSDNSPVDPAAINATCKDGKIGSGTTEEHQSGSVYLEIDAGIAWTVQVQALQ